MKKKLALGLGLVGAGLLALSLMVFGMGAAATLNPTAADLPTARTADTAVLPAVEANLAPTAAPSISEATETEAAETGAAETGAPDAIESPDATDLMASDAFRAMTPDEQANGREWMKTMTITASCMKEKGYDYTFTPFWERENGTQFLAWEKTLPAAELAEARLALDGDTGSGADYHWDDAGCWGYAVHVMGNDKNH